MLVRSTVVLAATLWTALLALLALPASPAHALSSKECSAKYQAAKKDGTLGGKSWNDFRKAECGAEAKPAGAPTATPAAGSGGGAVFPSKVDDKYAKESAGRARMHTCRDQYQANKANNANGGLKWIQKGGGYYSECNKKLKAAA